jgi:hypothetical protein
VLYRVVVDQSVLDEIIGIAVVATMAITEKNDPGIFRQPDFAGSLKGIGDEVLYHEQ